MHRYRTNQCTAAEAEQLIAHIKRGRDRELVESLLGQVHADRLVDDPSLQPALDRVFRNVQHAKRDALPSTTRAWKAPWAWAAAAAVVFAVGVFLWQGMGPIREKPEVVQMEISDIAPGGNRATLKLADGREIDLSEAQAGIVVGDDVTYLDGSAVLGDEAGGGKRDRVLTGAPVYTLTTPKGGTYQITLPDGTNVWLNAASTLTYPPRFASGERRVFLSGEAFFDVKTDKRKPFRVESHGQEVEVLGTAFNVSAYPDERYAKTTLVEGAVRLGSDWGNVTLEPGQQGTLAAGAIRVASVDVAAYVGWKDNEFVFDGIALQDAMKQLSRWYDMEVVYEGEIPILPFYGSFSRSLPLSETLAILKEAKVGFTMQQAGAVKRLVIHRR